MYPLTADFEPPILDFIQRLNTQEGVEIHTSPMSTQITGDYEQVMELLKEEMRPALNTKPATVMVMKILRRDET